MVHIKITNLSHNYMQNETDASIFINPSHYR